MMGEESGPRSSKEKKTLFPGAKIGLKSLRNDKLKPASKYYDYETTLSFGIATTIFLLIPYIHFDIIYSLWSEYTRPVNKTTCTCNCWDSTFKSNYEAGTPRYKHVYFNITSNSLKMWAVTILAILLFYETIRKTCHLMSERRLRRSMLVLFVASIYPHYYSWWSFFNFWNDEYQHQWSHQLLFSITECVSTYFVVHLLDLKESTTPWKLMVVLSVATAHCLTSLRDQFGYNVIRGEGELHQVLRDVGFMLPDLLCVYVALREMKVYARRNYVPVSYLVSNATFGCSFGFVLLMFISSTFL
uniref:Uncharacterized protein n=1 Tax=Strigamia maritima TaxID=126957 RepID=T1J3S7_STRMM